MNRPRKKDRHLPANMYFKHGRHWYVKGGVWRALAVDLGDALKEYADIVDAPRGGCAELIDTAFQIMKARTGDAKLAENTIDQYDVAARRLKKILAEFAPQQVKPKHIAKIKRALGQTPNMCNRILSFGRQVFDHALEEQVIDVNPFVGVKRHKEARRTRLILQIEWDAIYAKAGERLRCVMDLLFLTDQRVDDVLAIDERDILDDGPGIYFEQGKTGKELIVAWNQQLREAIARARALHGKVVKVNFEDKTRPRPLFKTRHGKRPAYRTVYDQWVRAVGEAGIVDCNLHDNRAFSATEAKRQGLDPQKLLGHDDHRTTKIYLRGREVEVVEGPMMVRSA